LALGPASSRIGRALTDARPGELVEYVGADIDPRGSQPVTLTR